MRRLKIKGYLILMLLSFFTLSAQAQSEGKKPGCDPSACGPENTKVEEAQAITDLRTNLQTLLQNLDNSPYNFSKDMLNYQIPKGKNEDESLRILLQTIQVLNSELLTHIPEEKLLPAFKNRNTSLPQDNRSIMIHLIKQTKLLKQQIQTIQ